MGGDIANLFNGGMTKPMVVSPEGAVVGPVDAVPAVTQSDNPVHLPNEAVKAPNIGFAGGQVQAAPNKPVDDGSSSMPSFIKPSFAQATAPNPATGMPTAPINNPMLTKGGKLVSFLASVAQGGLAGRAASEQAVAASGGHRSGGFGVGAEAAIQQPFQQAAMRQQVAQGAMQNQMGQAQLQQMQTPVTVNGQQQPFWLAKRNAELEKMQAEAYKDRMVTPRNGGVYDTRTGTYLPGTEPQEKNQTVENQLAAAVQKAIDGHVNPAEDPTVQQISDVITSKMRQPENKTNPDSIWYRSFKQEHGGQEPGTQDLLGYLKAKAQSTHITVSTNAGSADSKESLAQGLSNYTLSPQSMGRMNGADKEWIIARARQINPKFDMTQYPAKQAVITGYASGKQADQIQAFDAFLGHANDLSEQVNQMRITRSPLINRPWMWIEKNVGNPEVAAYYAKIQPVRDEFMTFLQNNHALTEMDKKDVDAIMDRNASPAQMQATIKSMMGTAGIRLGSLNQRYKNQMGMDYPNLVSPEGATVMQKFGIKTGGGTKGGSSLPQVPGGHVRFRDSMGGVHDIPSGNLDAARQRDPNLQVIQ